MLRWDQDLGLTIFADEDEESNTPLHLAATNGRFLPLAFSDVVQELMVGVGHVNACKVLLEAGANIAARNAILWTPLDCAAAHGLPDHSWEIKVSTGGSMR